MFTTDEYENFEDYEDYEEYEDFEEFEDYGEYDEEEAIECWNKINFGLRLARIRNERRISARQLSLDLGYNKNYIYSIESGRNFPTMKNFFEICTYLKINPERFFGTPSEDLFFPYFTRILEKLDENHLQHLYQLAEDLAEIR